MRFFLFSLLVCLLPALSVGSNAKQQLANELRNQELVCFVPDSLHPFYQTLAISASAEWQFCPVRLQHAPAPANLSYEENTAFLVVDTNVYSPQHELIYHRVKLMVWDKNANLYSELASMVLPAEINETRVPLAQNTDLVPLTVRHLQYEAYWYLEHSTSPMYAVRSNPAYVSAHSADSLLQGQHLLLPQPLANALPTVTAHPWLRFYDLSTEVATRETIWYATNACVAVFEYDALAIYRQADGRKVGQLTVVSSGQLNEQQRNSVNPDVCCTSPGCSSEYFWAEVILAGLGVLIPLAIELLSN